MISGCNNMECTLRSDCHRGQVKTELGDTYIIGEVVDGKCETFIPHHNNRSDEVDESHDLDMVMNDMVKDFTDEDFNVLLSAIKDPQVPNEKLKEMVENYTKVVTQRVNDRGV